MLALAVRHLVIRPRSVAAPALILRRWASDDSHSDFAPQHKEAKAADVRDLLEADVASHRVFLFMKGYPHAPQCGFSNHVCRILDITGVEYGSRNVLESEDVRQGVKAFSDWPTIPQLYVDGDFVGGCDIVDQLFREGELHGLLGVAAPVEGMQKKEGE